MNKRRIILISVFSLLLAIVITLVVLFNAVFVLREQTITYLSEVDKAEIQRQYPELTDSEILKHTNFQLKKSIFSQDKENAKNSIEQEYAFIKVVNISAVSINKIDIQLKARYKMFYYNIQDKYYILDEDLKVLRKGDNLEADEQNLIKIEPVKNQVTNEKTEKLTDNLLNVTEHTKQNEFIGVHYQAIFANLYNSIYKNVTIQKQVDEDLEQAYLEREDIKDLLSEVSFKVGYAYERLILNVHYTKGEQKYDYTIDIGKPDDRLEYKIRYCFSAIPTLLDDETNIDEEKRSNGTIRFYFDEKGQDICCYFDQENNLICVLSN